MKPSNFSFSDYVNKPIQLIQNSSSQEYSLVIYIVGAKM